MTIRANITTTYRTNIDPPREEKTMRKKWADNGVRESEGTQRLLDTAAKTPEQWNTPEAEDGGNRSAVRTNGQTPRAVDEYVRGTTGDSARSSDQVDDERAQNRGRPDRKGESATKPTSSGYRPGQTTQNNRAPAPRKSPAASEATKPEVDERKPEKVPVRSGVTETSSQRPDARDSASGDSASSTRVPIPEKQQTEQKVKGADESRRQRPKESTPPLPIASRPTIYQASAPPSPPPRSTAPEPAESPDSGAELSEEKETAPADGVSTSWVTEITDEASLQKGITQALQYGRPPESANASQSDGGKTARHLQSEGVFGISSSGRNLGVVDFIRQKQFEYNLDQKPFTGEDLLLETEKAIYNTLSSDQSTAVSKSLLQAAESVNAYRNQVVKSTEFSTPEPKAGDSQKSVVAADP
jgi:hypothetical protein